MYTVDINDYMYKYYIRHQTMYGLSMSAFQGTTNANELNVFIDINSFASSLFTRNEVHFTYKDNTVLASSLINLAIHIRHYFFNQHQTKTNIYLVWAENCPAIGLANEPSYNAHYKQAFDSKLAMRDLLNATIDMLQTLCPYFIDMYFINGYSEETGTIVASLLEDILGKSDDVRCPNLIYSKDPFMMQLVGMYPQTYMFYPKKRNGIDSSFCVKKSNLLDSYRTAHKLSKKVVEYDPVIETKITYTQDHVIRRSNFNSIIDLVGMSCRGLRGSMSFNAGCDRVYRELLACGYVTSLREFEILDINNQLIAFKRSPYYESIRSGIVNLVMTNDILEVNDKILVNYPIDLLFL